MTIKILGMGCAKCNALEKNVENVLKSTGITAEVEHVTDVKTIVGYGVMSTPALVIDEKVVSVGRVLTEAELEKLIKNA
ncbi:thioredoxin family protein [Guggenheimella bovis]